MRLRARRATGSAVKTALLGSMVVFGVMTLAATMADSTTAFGVPRLLAGLGLGGAMPNAAALAA